MSRHTGRQVGRIAIIAFLILALIGACGLVIISLYYKDYVKKHLAERVSKASDGKYSASIQDVDFNLLSRQLTVTGLEFWPDASGKYRQAETGKPVDITIRLSVPKFRFEGVSIFRLLRHRELSVSHASIWKGKLVVICRERHPDSTRLRVKAKSTLRMLLSDRIDVYDPDISFRYIPLHGDAFDCSLKGGKAVLANWRLVPGKKEKDTSRLLGARSLRLDGPSFRFDKNSLLYRFKAGAVYFNSDERKFRASELSMLPFADEDAFYKRLGHRATVWKVRIPELEAFGFEWQKLVCANMLQARKISLKAPDINLFYNYLVPAQRRNMLEKDPPRLFHQMPLKVDIHDIKATGGHVSYTELNDKTMRRGKLYADGLRIHATNFTNVDSLIRRNNHFLLHLEGSFLRRTAISATYSLTLTDETGAFRLEAHARDMEADQIRQAAEAMTLLKIDSLHMQKMDVYMNGDQNHAEANLHLSYSGLKLELLKASDPPGLETKTVTSAIAKEFFIYKDNPENGEAPRVTTASIPRDITTSYLSLMVKGLKTTTKEMLIKHPGVVAEVTGDQDLKSQKKKGFFYRLIHRK